MTSSRKFNAKTKSVAGELAVAERACLELVREREHTVIRTKILCAKNIRVVAMYLTYAGLRNI